MSVRAQIVGAALALAIPGGASQRQTGVATTADLAMLVQQDNTAAAQRADRQKTPPILEGTHWKLIELAGAPALPSSDAAEVSLVLNAPEKRLAGSGGCNRLIGGYRLRGHSLHFTPAGTTRMMCPGPVMKQEQALLEALAKTTSYRIVSKELELRDAERVLARFEPGALGQEQPSPESPSKSVADEWLGQWNGPEGTYLLLSKNGGKYVVKIRSLDGLKTYEGISVGDRIEFLRDGKTESIHAGSGRETGMKWLLDKKNCLIIKTGEGFCRD